MHLFHNINRTTTRSAEDNSPTQENWAPLFNAFKRFFFFLKKYFVSVLYFELFVYIFVLKKKKKKGGGKNVIKQSLVSH
jgi:hypothetical protein